MRLFAVLAGVVLFAQLGGAQERGTIDDPSGSAELRATQSTDAASVAAVTAGEPFNFECKPGAEWCQVTLSSGKTGWIQRERIRFFFTEEDLPSDEKDPNGLSEIDAFARAHGFNYARTTRRAARGELKAMQRFFAIAQDVDGGAAESHTSVPFTVYHILGDDRFSKFLNTQPIAYRTMVRNSILSDDRSGWGTEYLRLHFPLTTSVLFPKEIIGWLSPDKRYAIRKVFSDQFRLSGSKVIRAELIDQKSGEVLCDLTPDDIGTDAQREGEVLWAPDSKRFAYVSSDLTVSPGNLWSTPRPPPQRKQTAVYQATGQTFARVELPLDDVPGRTEDAELKSAILGHEFVEPLRWKKPNVLVLQRHEYFETLKPLVVGGKTFDTIHGLSRMYEITATIPSEGVAPIVWKQCPDH